LILNLGVLDVAYITDTNSSEYNAHITTGTVAQELEQRYGVMNFFYYMRQKEINNYVITSLNQALNSIILGRPASNLFARAETLIQDDFKQFLTLQSLDYQVRGVPTGAALRGVSHRFKMNKNNRRSRSGKVYKQGVPRPSFVDTGLYRASFKAWFTS
jgi:hypothetical protein